MDATLEKVFKKVAEKHNVDIKEVENMFKFHQRKIKEKMVELGKEYDTIYIPYICNLDFIKTSYERQRNKKINQESSECKES